MIDKRFISLGTILLAVLTVFVFSMDGQAADETGPAGFTVESIIPDNQVDTTRTFFYLDIEPAVPQTIQVRIKSLQEEPVTIQLGIHDAVSSSVGAIDYAQDQPKLDKSLTNPITSFVKLKNGTKEITVANFEEKIVEYEITPPEEPFDGVKLGSLRFLKKEATDEKQTGVVPEYAYVIALMVTEDKEAFNHGADLHLKRVGLQIANGRKVIAAHIQNDQPKVLQEMIINGTIKRKGSKEVIESHEMENFSVAPNSNFNFEIPLGIENFQPGTYVFTGTAKGDDRTWKWEEEFTIGREEAEKVNQEAAYRLRVPTWVPWVASGLALALIGLIGGLVYRQRKWLEGRK